MVLLLSLTAPMAGFPSVVYPAITLSNPSSIRKRPTINPPSLTVPVRPRRRGFREPKRHQKALSINALYSI